ncbi:hypothetical protein GCM10009817_22070 [Terrabacter lapilli]|uniref:Uncharacterized protein n=2 Tax=Terrabacter lapilli TaxID=436231 RepID=A0ABN2S5E8_9MICO
MTRATIIWFVGAAVVGAVAGGLHLLRSQTGGAHEGLPLAVGAFGLTVVAAAMLFHGVMVAAGEQDALAGPDPVVEDDGVGDTEQTDEVAGLHEHQDVHEQVHEHGAEAGIEADAGIAADAEVQEIAPERHDGERPSDETAYDPASSDDGQAVYTFRRGKPVREQAERTGRPPRRDRPA